MSNTATNAELRRINEIVQNYYKDLRVEYDRNGYLRELLGDLSPDKMEKKVAEVIGYNVLNGEYDEKTNS